ncbi:MAG TPA: hypothetical protein VN578_17190, partial [Candidatus Binatia bacterium]|nr:hypothetical protein [Candidatus Binatia bacterium]
MDTNTIVRLNAEGAMAGCKPASPTRATVALWKGFVLALIAVCLAGCEDLKPITQSNPTSNANGSTDEMHELLMQMRPPEPKPAPPAPQPAPPAQRLAEPKAPPAVAGKGAEKLVAPASPVVVRPTTS